MSIGFWQIAIVVVLVVLLFGRGKISDLMGDVAKGIKSFKKGMKEPTESVTQDEANQDKTSEDSKKDSK
tara:strand:+ start:190 stop:396 length:207 start_codon:yes stop_codon:yes gene_type:complete